MTSQSSNRMNLPIVRAPTARPIKRQKWSNPMTHRPSDLECPVPGGLGTWQWWQTRHNGVYEPRISLHLWSYFGKLLHPCTGARTIDKSVGGQSSGTLRVYPGSITVSCMYKHTPFVAISATKAQCRIRRARSASIMARYHGNTLAMPKPANALKM